MVIFPLAPDQTIAQMWSNGAPPSPKTLPYRTKHEVDRITVAEIWPFAYLGAYGTPIFGGKGGLRGSAIAPFERAIVVSYRLSIVTVALCGTIRPQFAIECLQRSNQQGVGDFGPKFRGVPLEQTRHVGVAKSKRPRPTNGEIIFEEFQLM